MLKLNFGKNILLFIFLLRLFIFLFLPGLSKDIFESPSSPENQFLMVMIKVSPALVQKNTAYLSQYSLKFIYMKKLFVTDCFLLFRNTAVWIHKKSKHSDKTEKER